MFVVIIHHVNCPQSLSSSPFVDGSEVCSAILFIYFENLVCDLIISSVLLWHVMIQAQTKLSRRLVEKNQNIN